GGFVLKLPFSFQLDTGLTEIQSRLLYSYKMGNQPGREHIKFALYPNLVSPNLHVNLETGDFDYNSSFFNPYRAINKDLLEKGLLSFWTHRGFTVQEQSEAS
ncbi:hypothetical protein TI03_03720, partial [Achromatium sp. WMS1]